MVPGDLVMISKPLGPALFQEQGADLRPEELQRHLQSTGALDDAGSRAK